MKNILKERLRVLTTMTGISGQEQDIARYMKSEFEKYCDDVSVDAIGNVTAVKKGSKPGPSLMLISHMDEIGFSVKTILPNGFILFDKIGSAPNKVMEGRKVFINGTIPAVIGIKPGHLQTPDEAKTCKTPAQCYMDIGACSKEEVEALGIRTGSPITYESSFTEMANPDYVCTKSIDDRINCTILVELLKALKDKEVAGTIYFVASVQEETGMKGAYIAGNHWNPDYAIAMDTIPCGDTPDVNFASELSVGLGKGPAIVLCDDLSLGLLTTFANKKVVDIADAAAKKLNISVQYATIMGAGYATDAARLSFAGDGIPCVTIATPRRYSHSPVEMLNLNDAVDTFRLLEELILQNSETTDLKFI